MLQGNNGGVMQVPYPIAIQQQFEAFDWQTLAELMGIPHGRLSTSAPTSRGAFIRLVQYTIEQAWRHAAKAREKPAGRCLAAIDADSAKICRALVRSIERRGALLQAEDRLILENAGRYLEFVGTPKRGPRQRRDGFAHLLQRLLFHVCVYDGRVSFNRKTAAGNILEMVERLRPIMPPGLTPKDLDDHRNLIERLATKVRARVREMGPLELDLAQAGFGVLDPALRREFVLPRDLQELMDRRSARPISN